jgi:hypothetical protein
VIQWLCLNRDNLIGDNLEKSAVGCADLLRKVGRKVESRYCNVPAEKDKKDNGALILGKYKV